MAIAYSFALILVLLLGLPFWLVRMATSGKYREGLAGRLGRVPAWLLQDRGRQSIWIHAVSVGEVVAASRLVKELAARAPQYRVLLSTTTRTGQRMAREYAGAERTFYFPLDLPWIVRRYLRRLRPALLVLVESEFWPNLLEQCRQSGIPVAVVNGRVSDRSFPRYLRLKFFWKNYFAGLAIVLAQSEEDKKRFCAIGVPSGVVAFGGNLKFDVRAVETAPVTTALRSHLAPDTKVLVCGSTAEGEEEILLDAFHTLQTTIPALVMVLAPRHPERFAQVADLLRARGTRSLRASIWRNQPGSVDPGTVFLLDSIGELASLYSLATVAFVGWSLTPDGGGHNPLEPAQYGLPIVMGTYYLNFRAIVATLLEAEGLMLADKETLAPVLAKLLTDSEAAGVLGAHALEVFDSQAGATERAVSALLRLLPQGAHAAASPAGEAR